MTYASAVVRPVPVRIVVGLRRILLWKMCRAAPWAVVVQAGYWGGVRHASTSSGPGIMKKGLIIAVLTTACNFANAQDRGIVQNWNSDYTAREWLVDCDQKRDQCYFFTRTVAQASFWFDKCIPDGTSIAEIAGVMMTFIERNPQNVDSPATNVLLTALHERWKCPR
jgi:hypothetical protein